MKRVRGLGRAALALAACILATASARAESQQASETLPGLLLSFNDPDMGTGDQAPPLSFRLQQMDRDAQRFASARLSYTPPALPWLTSAVELRREAFRSVTDEDLKLRRDLALRLTADLSDYAVQFFGTDRALLTLAYTAWPGRGSASESDGPGQMEQTVLVAAGFRF